MAVTTHAQKNEKEEEAAIQEEKERKFGAVPSPVEKQTPARGKEATDIESNMLGAEFADELFSGGRTRDRRTRKKREHNFKFIQKQRGTH